MPLWDEVFARELYNHTGDSGDAFTTDAFENINQADDPALGSLVGKLSEQLRQEFQPFILGLTDERATTPVGGRPAVKNDDTEDIPDDWASKIAASDALFFPGNDTGDLSKPMVPCYGTCPGPMCRNGSNGVPVQDPVQIKRRNIDLMCPILDWIKPDNVTACEEAGLNMWMCAPPQSDFRLLS